MIHVLDAIQHVQPDAQDAQHPVRAVRDVHPVRVAVNQDVTDVADAVRARGIAQSDAVAHAEQGVLAPVIVNARDARPPVQARVMTLARHRMKRRPSPIWAVISASEIL